jgi:transketolase
MSSSTLDMKSAFPQAIEAVGKLSNKVVVVVGDIGHFALQGFAKENPTRYYNLGILEPTLVSVCAGISKEGFYPIGHTIAPFITERSLEQIKLDFCYQGLGGNLITVGSAFDYSTLGCTHHCYTDLCLIGSYPNTEVCYPSSPNELISLIKQKYNSPSLTYYRMARATHGEIFENVEFGKIIQVKSGESITLLASGPQLKTALELAEALEQSGKTVDVLYCHTYKPFDERSLQESVAKTGRLFVIEEHVYNGGLASLALRCSRNISSIRFDCHCIPDSFIRHYGSYANIAEGLGFTAKYLLPKINALF